MLISRDSIEAFRTLRELNARYWIAVSVSPVLALFALGVSQASTFGLITTLFYLAVWIQSIRGLRYTSLLKKKLRQSPSEVRRNDILKGPIILGIPGMHWFASLAR
ncbi:hypothetical protein ISG33_14315 [Glaciecola sp. MH2013]|uniref:hypothetical protein n=1 Tax=Glaciecola sp. MH2013 TaxID=2785524 RepID=UPI00189F156D|nr:hypothetical protein [Glaciecola sp. MH2013]MBF7074576.1 hypothetical protein [Glaciecola sp. MH2013]